MDNPEVQIPTAESADVEMEETREPAQQKNGTGESVEQKDAESTQDNTIVPTEGDSVSVPEKNQGLKFIEYGYPFPSNTELFRALLFREYPGPSMTSSAPTC